MEFGADLFSQLMQRIIQNGNLYAEFMNTVLEATQITYAKEGSGDKLNGIHNKMSRHLLELYQESVGKYLAAPQLGISREALQQINIALNAYHKFLGETGDFLMMFSTPLKKSADILQLAIQDRERANEGFKSAKEVYNFAVKVLDKEYEAWLKSPEGVRSVVNMVDKYLDFRKKLNPVKDSWYKSLSIPTKKEMEDVYRGIYDLKKKSRQQDAIIHEQTDTINKLNHKIRKLEVTLAKYLPKKKTATSRRAKNKKKTG